MATNLPLQAAALHYAGVPGFLQHYYHQGAQAQQTALGSGGAVTSPRPHHHPPATALPPGKKAAGAAAQAAAPQQLPPQPQQHVNVFVHAGTEPPEAHQALGAGSPMPMAVGTPQAATKQQPQAANSALPSLALMGSSHPQHHQPQHLPPLGSGPPPAGTAAAAAAAAALQQHGASAGIKRVHSQSIRAATLAESLAPFGNGAAAAAAAAAGGSTPLMGSPLPPALQQALPAWAVAEPLRAPEAAAGRAALVSPSQHATMRR